MIAESRVSTQCGDLGRAEASIVNGPDREPAVVVISGSASFVWYSLDALDAFLAGVTEARALLAKAQIEQPMGGK